MSVTIAPGCGGSSSARGTEKTSASTPQGSEAAPQLTKAQFIARANEVCEEDVAQMRKRVSEYRREWGREKHSKPPFTREAADVFLPALQFMYDHINFGGPPREDEAYASDMLRTMELTVVSTENQRIYSIDQLVTLFRRFNRMARSYQLDSCGVDHAIFASR